MTQSFVSRNCEPQYDVILIAVAWIYVVLMMALAEATSTQGTLLGAVITFLLYGVMPLSFLLYILGTRRRTRRAAEAAKSAQPDGGSLAAGDTVAAERKEP